MEKTNNENISPLIEFNVKRVAKVLFALKDEDDLLYLQEDDFKPPLMLVCVNMKYFVQGQRQKV